MEKQSTTAGRPSVAVRRQRRQERQRSKDFIIEQREERKRRLERYSQAYSNTGSDRSRSTSPENDSNAETPSEYSAQTPDDMSSPEVDMKGHIADLSTTRVMKVPLAIKVPLRRPSNTRMNSYTRSSSLKPSQSEGSDFQYSRYSVLLEDKETASTSQSTSRTVSATTAKEVQSEEGNSTDSEDDADSEDDDEFASYSPIEVATPIAIAMPKTRPSVISVSMVSPFSRDPNRMSTRTTSTTLSLKTLDIPVQKQSTWPMSAKFASEQRAKPESATTASVATTEAEAIPERSQSIADPSSIPISLKKKSSMPMLSKFAHKRMSSIKSFVKQPNIGEPPSVPVVPPRHQSRPSTGVNTLFANHSTHNLLTQPSSNIASTVTQPPPSPRRSLTEPLAPLLESRPKPSQGARSSMLTPTISTAAPAPPIPEIPEEDTPAMSRKKSFSNLRRRSGSIGQALKSSLGMGSRPSIPDVPVPALPAAHAQTSNQQQMPDLRRIAQKNASTSNLSHISRSSMSQRPSTGNNNLANIQRASVQVLRPSMLTNVRKSSGLMMYSPFPSTSKAGEPVGLGLKM